MPRSMVRNSHSRSAMAPRVKSGQGAITQSRILGHALRLFAQHGYQAVSIRAIAQAAGANLGAVNYHFGTKRQLFLTVIADVVEREWKHADGLLSAQHPRECRKALARWSDSCATEDEQQRVESLLLFRALVEDSESRNLVHERLLSPLLARLSTLVAALGSVQSRQEAEYRATALVASYMFACYQRLVGNRGHTRACHKGFLEAVLRVLVFGDRNP